MNVRETIADFLKAEHDLNDNIPAHLFDLNMEVQVMVDTEGCEHAKDESGHDIDNLWRRQNSRGETDTIWNIRIPKRADSNPDYRDHELKWSLVEHATAIGVTGWDWKHRISKHLAFDIDLATEAEHVESGVSAADLQRVRDAIEQIPWIETRKSTSGSGLHARVFVNVPTDNHTEHARLGKYVRKVISDTVGFDVAEYIDISGGNTWIWAKRATPENEGFKLLKEAVGLLDVPDNWRELLPPERKLAGADRAGPIVALDKLHNALIDWLTAHGWIADECEHDGRFMLRTHTRGLAEAFAAMKLPGVFETISNGSDGTKQNCYCFAKPEGRWIVHRYQAAKELPSWNHDDDDTWCYFGVPMTLEQAAAKLGVVEGVDGFTFDNVAQASEAAKLTGYELLPHGWQDRQITMTVDKGVIVASMGRYTVKENADASDPATTGSKCKWKADGKSKWSYLVGAEKRPDTVSEKYVEQRRQFLREQANDIVRHVLVNGEDAGWYAKIHGQWVREPKDHCGLILRNSGVAPDDIVNMLAKSAGGAWLLVDKPFDPLGEYTGLHEWNLFGAKYAVDPSPKGKPLSHPHYDMVLEHCGAYLTPAVLENDWCQRHSIVTGGQYLLHWLACKVQKPEQHLPYLFQYGPQKCGKSSLYNMMRFLVTKGIRHIDKAFTRKSTFNAELAGTLIGVIEETVLTPETYETLKQITTNDEIAVEFKGKDPFDMKNRIGIIHNSNKWYAAAIPEQDDTRIVAIEVWPIQGPKVDTTVMLKRWRDEAADFLRTLLDLPLPEEQGDDRLFLPVLMTDLKQRIIAHYQEQDGKADDDRTYHNEAARLCPAVEAVGRERLNEVIRMGMLRQALVTAGVKDVPEPRTLGRTVGQMGGMLQDRGLCLEHDEDSRGSWVRFTSVHNLN